MKRKKLIIPVFLAMAAVFMVFTSGYSVERELLAPDTPEEDIIRMHPRYVDPSLLPLDKIENLHQTGTPQDVNIQTWRLTVTGQSVRGPVEFHYTRLQQMPQVQKKILLICPGFFKDYAQWEGVLLTDILKEAGVSQSYQSVIIKGKDGYSERFLRTEINQNLILLALKVNGTVLPKEHGFPLRLVAEDEYGGKWVKWVTEIEVQ